IEWWAQSERPTPIWSLEKSRGHERSGFLSSPVAPAPPGSRSGRHSKATAFAKVEMIFDTDVLIWAARGSERAACAIDAAPNRALAIISLMELLQGARAKLEARQI